MRCSMHLHSRTLALSLVVAMAAACRATSPGTAGGPANQPPLALAGPDVSVLVGTPVALDGSASRDPEDAPLAFDWHLTANPEGGAVALTGKANARASFTPWVVGTYEVELVVNDGVDDSEADRVTVTATNTVPVANAGSDVSVVAGFPVTLDAFGSVDADGQPLSYQWTVVAYPAGGAVTLIGDTESELKFYPVCAGDYVLSLVVSDGYATSSADTVTLTVTGTNTAPIAAAGADAVIALGHPFVVDGSASTDAESPRLAYRWALVGDPSAGADRLVDAGSAQATLTPSVLGDYTLSLIVNDGLVDSVADTVTLSVLSADLPRQVAVGNAHACALLLDGSVLCWGGNALGALGDGTTEQRNTPVAVSTDPALAHGWSSVSAGYDFTCATRQEGAYCWGWNAHGSLGHAATAWSSTTPVPVDGGLPFRRLAAGRWHACGIASGNLYCWGFDFSGQLGDGGTQSRPSPVATSLSGAWTDVAAAESRSCGIEAGRLLCWGYGVAGTPTPMDANSDWSAVVTGGAHTCGLRADGVYCFGDNSYGQAGGTASPVSSPQLVSGAGAWQLTAASEHTCGLLAGQVSCMGLNDIGQLGTNLPPSSITSMSPAVPETDYAYVGTGPRNTCAIRAGTIVCTGPNESGQLGVGPPVSNRVPTRVGTATDWTAVVAASESSCGQRGGALYCWGGNSDGQVGDGSRVGRDAPTLVSGGDAPGWSSLAMVGATGACALRGGAIYCWGRGLGPSWGQTDVAPVQFAAGPGWTTVFGGPWAHACAIDGGHLLCWGADQLGMLGNGTSLGQSATPVEVDGAFADWQVAGLGFDHGCGVRPSGLYCWGNAFAGGLGVDTAGVSQQSPVLVSSSATWTALSLGNYSSCGIDGGTLYCWGLGNGGGLGLGDLADRATPTALGGAAWTTVSCRGAHCCGIQSGELYCWGYNGSGQVGDDTTVNALAPVRLGTANDWTTTAAGSMHSCGVRAGELYCWGANTSGQLGLGTPPSWTVVLFP